VPSAAPLGDPKNRFSPLQDVVQRYHGRLSFGLLLILPAGGWLGHSDLREKGIFR
jgi:hypothetical protein